jgi:hypothetical protein
MKKLPLLLAALCLAQLTFSQTRFGIRGGLNIANQKVKINVMGTDVAETGDAIPSFHIGGVGEFGLSEFFFVQGSLMLNGKGCNLSGQDDMGNPTTANVRPFYLELPIVLLVKTQIPNSSLKVIAGAGPSLGYGIFGKVKSSGTSEDAFQDGGFKRFDFGIDINAGVELKQGAQISFHYTPGLANIGPSNSGYDINWKNRVISFSFAYFFGGNEK